MWRMQRGSPTDEAAAAFWQAVRADPGYMPAARAAARMAAGRSNGGLHELLERYESLAGPEKARSLRRYCESLEAGP
jgi:hypothetical protein